MSSVLLVGLSYNGCMEMNDNYGSEGEAETLYWTTFGDPSFVVRSGSPEEIVATHSGVVILGGSQLNVQTNSNGSVAALSKNGADIKCRNSKRRWPLSIKP